MTRYGNSIGMMSGLLVAWVVLAAILAVILFFVRKTDFGLIEHALASVALGLVITVAMPIAVLPTCLFEITLDNTHIMHRFLGRYVLSRKKIVDLKSVEIAQGWGAKLTFRDRSAIRFLGAHLGILQELRDDLKRVAPNNVRFD